MSAATGVSGSNRTHYPALDGIRGLAALSVFAFHYMQVPLTWAGVDIFFVLSGFLITGLLVDARHSVFRVRRFYVARALRILPLYYGTLTVLWLGTTMVGSSSWPAQMALWPLYVGNFLRPLASSDRFDALGSIRIGHFWSLCVEEQFYLAWPVVVFATRNDRQLERVCATVAITAALVRALVAFLGPSSWIVNDLLYRATLFRIDGLALGGWLAIRTRHGNMCPRAGARLFMGAVSALVVIGFIDWRWFGSDTMMPESRVMAGLGFPCLALLAAGAIAASLDPRSALAIDRAAAPLRSLGKISYGFYVFHVLPRGLLNDAAVSLRAQGWPFAIVASGRVVAGLGLGYAVAWASYRFWESPFLRLKSRLQSEWTDTASSRESRDLSLT